MSNPKQTKNVCNLEVTKENDGKRSDAWGVINLGNEVHVVPCNKETGKITAPHILDAFCACEPLIELAEEGILFYRHNVFH